MVRGDGAGGCVVAGVASLRLTLLILIGSQSIANILNFLFGEIFILVSSRSSFVMVNVCLYGE